MIDWRLPNSAGLEVAGLVCMLLPCTAYFQLGHLVKVVTTDCSTQITAALSN